MVTEAEISPGSRPPAPGRLAIIEDFVNTRDVEGEKEYLVRPESLAKWLTKWGFVDERPALTAADLERAKAVREALRVLLLANSGEPLDPEAPATLNRAGRDAPLAVEFALDGSAQLAPAASGVDAALGGLLAIVYEAMVEGTWTRLKACRSETCQWAFYDASKNQSKRWCAMGVCGNRMKTRAYRARQRRDGGG